MKSFRVLSTTVACVFPLAGGAGAAEWRVPSDFPTIQAAIDSASVANGDAIVVSPGQHAGATVTKAVTIRGTGRAQIVDGPVVSALGKAGFYFAGSGAGSGATISDFSFSRLEFPVFSRGADDVTVTRNTMAHFLQGVTNWAYGSWGNRWEISDNTMHNLMTSCGGGVGILIGDYLGGTVSGNAVARNRIRGRLRVAADDCGGYNAPGILLYADFRGGAAGATIQANSVTKNRVVLTAASLRVGGPPWLVTASGIELSDTRNDPGILPPALGGNVVTFNDLRDMEVPFLFTPDEVETANTIENNYTGPGGGFPDRRPGGSVLTRPEASPVR
jgi:Right handed beta helix region